MTREEAINILHGMRADNFNLDDLYTKDKYNALEMAIKALEQEKPETVTEFADRCRECGARYGKLLKDAVIQGWNEGRSDLIEKIKREFKI